MSKLPHLCRISPTLPAVYQPLHAVVNTYQIQWPVITGNSYILLFMLTTYSTQQSYVLSCRLHTPATKYRFHLSLVSQLTSAQCASGLPRETNFICVWVNQNFLLLNTLERCYSHIFFLDTYSNSPLLLFFKTPFCTCMVDTLSHFTATGSHSSCSLEGIWILSALVIQQAHMSL